MKNEHKHKGATRWHPIDRVHKKPAIARAHEKAITEAMMDEEVTTDLVEEQTIIPENVTPVETVIKHFIPLETNIPVGGKQHVIVRFNKKVLQQMLNGIEQTGANEIGVLCAEDRPLIDLREE